MNKISGRIDTITVSDHLSLVRVMIHGIYLSAIVIDTPITCSYLKVGHPITVIFKETEVIIGKGMAHEISLQNRLPGHIISIDQGDLLSKIKVKTVAGTIASIITSRAVHQLQLAVGSTITAMIKTNEVMLSN